jgi:Skp family chaperone for outer membrane proteins
MLTVAFLVLGRLLLSTMPQVALLFKVLKRQVKVAWARRTHKKTLRTLRNTEQKALEQEQDALQEAWEQLDSTRPLESLRERKVRLFMSEYHLARRWSETAGEQGKEPRIPPEIIADDV